MPHLNYIAAICFFAAILCAACTSEKRYRTPTGLLYKLYSNEKDSVIRMGQTVKYHIIQRAGDSVIENTYGMMPKYWLCMPGYENRYNPLEVFDYGIREGDSIVTIQVVDSMVKKRILDTIPQWMKKGDKWTAHLKVVKVFTDDSTLFADKQDEADRVMKLQRKLGVDRIAKHLKKQKPEATLIGDSLYVQLVKEGTGPAAKTGDLLKVHFDIVSTRGQKLNSTRDTTSQGPASFMLGSGYFPSMLEAQLTNAKAGSHVNYYIPGILLFGPEPMQSGVKADDDWMISIEVLEVVDKGSPAE